MKKIKLTWKKCVAIVAGFFGIGTLVSCYGVIPYGQIDEHSGTVSGEIDGELKPIKGIKVSSYENDTFTDENGNYKISTHDYNDYLYFEDIDGEENGSFEGYSMEVTDETDYNVVLTAKTPEDLDD